MSATIRSSTASGKNVKTGLVMQPGGGIQFNRDGSVTAQEICHCIYSIALTVAPKRYITTHPIYPALICDSIDVHRLPGDIAQLTVDYIGDPSAYYGGVANQPTPLYTLVIEGGEEPIETFYRDGSVNFKSIATTANGAVLGANGLFAGWRSSSAFVGITSYIRPHSIWRMESFQKLSPTADDLNEVGYISTPSGPVPSVAAPYNWLLRTFDYQFQGAIYRYKKEWMLSGPRGWNTTIYSPP